MAGYFVMLGGRGTRPKKIHACLLGRVRIPFQCKVVSCVGQLPCRFADLLPKSVIVWAGTGESLLEPSRLVKTKVKVVKVQIRPSAKPAQMPAD